MSRLDVLLTMQMAEVALQDGGYKSSLAEMQRARAAVAELIEASYQTRIDLNLTIANLRTEVKAGRGQWDGVPEILSRRLELLDEAIAGVRGAA